MGRRSRVLKQRRVDRASVVELRTRRDEFSAEGRRRGCLFCRESDGGFTTVEHVLPESLGNASLVLPNGVVCDRCNNGPLSVLDQALCEFMPLRARQIMLGIPTKSGEVPSLKLANTAVTHEAPHKVVFETRHGPGAIREVGRSGDRVELTVRLAGGRRRLTSRYASELSRALLKATLEAAWIDHGELVLAPDFDHIREAVLGHPRDGFFGFVRHGDPDHERLDLQYVMRSTAAHLQGVGVACAIYGTCMLTDSILAAPASPFDPSLVQVIPFTSDDFKPKSRPA